MKKKIPKITLLKDLQNYLVLLPISKKVVVIMIEMFSNIILSFSFSVCDWYNAGKQQKKKSDRELLSLERKHMAKKRKRQKQ